MKTPKLPTPTPGANPPQAPRALGASGGLSASANPMARMFQPLASGFQSQRSGRRSLIGGAGL